MSEENVEIVERLLSEVPEPPPRNEVLEEFADPELEWIAATDSLVAGSYHGYDGIRRFWEKALSAWDEYRVEPLEVRDAGGDLVAATVQMTARTRDISVVQKWSILLTLREGKIVRAEGFSKPEGALEAAGRSD